MSTDHIEPSPLRIPLEQTTWDLDRSEGAQVNELKATHVHPMPDPLDVFNVPDDLKRNLAVTTVDALLNWGRKSGAADRTPGTHISAQSAPARALRTGHGHEQARIAR